jgi:hypothetical protein
MIESITIDYVRKPYLDALKIQDMLDKDPSLFEDSGFHTLLQLSKSIELHVRLLYMGEKSNDFGNNSFHFSRCCAAIRSFIEGGIETSDFKGFNDKTVVAKGHYFDKFSSKNGRRYRLLNSAQKIYTAGNPYRHNKVTSWVQVRPKFENILHEFEDFMTLFDELVK